MIAGVPVEPTAAAAGERRRGLGRWTMLLFVGGAAPIAFGFEVLLRALLLPPELEGMRAELRPALTPVAWVLAGATVPAVALGLLTKRWLVRRELARVHEPTPARRARIEVEALLLASSIPQLPALLATVASMFGAESAPVIAALVVSTAGVVAQGVGSRAADP